MQTPKELNIGMYLCTKGKAKEKWEKKDRSNSNRTISPTAMFMSACIFQLQIFALLGACRL